MNFLDLPCIKNTMLEKTDNDDGIKSFTFFMSRKHIVVVVV